MLNLKERVIWAWRYWRNHRKGRVGVNFSISIEKQDRSKVADLRMLLYIEPNTIPSLGQSLWLDGVFTPPIKEIIWGYSRAKGKYTGHVVTLESLQTDDFEGTLEAYTEAGFLC